MTKDEKKALRKIEFEEQLRKDSRAKMINKILLWIGVVCFLVGGFWFLNAATSTSSQPEQSVVIPSISKDDLTAGNAHAKVHIVEYSDFQCPSCLQAYPVLKQIQKEFGDQISFTYRYFPLLTVHKNALLSSSAAVAASKQGKFWEMHDLLFDNQDTWALLDDPRDAFLSYAQRLGLNNDQFKADMNDPKTAQFLNDQANKAVTIGLTGTPSIFINGKQAPSASYDTITSLIKAQLKNK